MVIHLILQIDFGLVGTGASVLHQVSVVVNLILFLPPTITDGQPSQNTANPMIRLQVAIFDDTTIVSQLYVGTTINPSIAIFTMNYYHYHEHSPSLAI